MNKTIQLFLLPYAGGSSFSFMKVIHFLSPQIEAIPIEYSGRGKRKDEPLIEGYASFLSDVVEKIKEHRNEELDFAILGYSMGSALAFDICSHDLLGEMPTHAFFCAEGSLMADNKARKFASLADEAFKEKVCQLGGIDERLLKDEAALNMYLNLIKADHNILGQYVYKGSHAECNASVIYNPGDPTCIDMEDWKKIVSGDVSFYQVGDNHFFVNQEYKRIAAIINQVLIPDVINSEQNTGVQV